MKIGIEHNCFATFYSLFASWLDVALLVSPRDVAVCPRESPCNHIVLDSTVDASCKSVQAVCVGGGLVEVALHERDCSGRVW